MDTFRAPSGEGEALQSGVPSSPSDHLGSADLSWVGSRVRTSPGACEFVGFVGRGVRLERSPIGARTSGETSLLLSRGVSLASCA